MAQDRSTQRTEPQAGRWPRWARGLALTLAVALGGCGGSGGGTDSASPGAGTLDAAGGEAERQHRRTQRADRREVADEGETGPQTDRDPDRVLAAAAQQLVRAPRRPVEPDARRAVTLQVVLDPHEDLGVDGLRAGVAAPEPAGDRGEQEQAVGREDEQPRQVDEVLRVQHQVEDVEAPARQVEEHRRAVVPGQPRQAVEDELRRPDERPAPGREPAVHRARVDRRLGSVHRHHRRLGGDGDDA